MGASRLLRTFDRASCTTSLCTRSIAKRVCLPLVLGLGRGLDNCANMGIYCAYGMKQVLRQQGGLFQCASHSLWRSRSPKQQTTKRLLKSHTSPCICMLACCMLPSLTVTGLGLAGRSLELSLEDLRGGMAGATVHRQATLQVRTAGPASRIAPQSKRQAPPDDSIADTQAVPLAQLWICLHRCAPDRLLKRLPACSLRSFFPLLSREVCVRCVPLAMAQCAGNRRNEAAALKLVEGRAPWNHGDRGMLVLRLRWLDEAVGSLDLAGMRRWGVDGGGAGKGQAGRPVLPRLRI